MQPNSRLPTLSALTLTRVTFSENTVNPYNQLYLLYRHKALNSVLCELQWHLPKFHVSS